MYLALSVANIPKWLVFLPLRNICLKWTLKQADIIWILFHFMQKIIAYTQAAWMLAIYSCALYMQNSHEDKELRQSSSIRLSYTRRVHIGIFILLIL